MVIYLLKEYLLTNTCLNIIVNGLQLQFLLLRINYIYYYYLRPGIRHIHTYYFVSDDDDDTRC